MYFPKNLIICRTYKLKAPHCLVYSAELCHVKWKRNRRSFCKRIFREHTCDELQDLLRIAGVHVAVVRDVGICDDGMQ